MAARRGAQLIAQMNSFVVPPGTLALWWLGQMGVAVKGPDQQIVYIDPFLTGPLAVEHPDPTFLWGRAVPPPLLPSDITNAALVICSHEHGDHTNPETLAGIAAASPQARFVATGWSAAAMASAGIAADRWSQPKTEIAHDHGVLQVRYIAAAHYTREYDAARGERWVSIHLDWGDVALFHSGDTVLYDGYSDLVGALPPADVGIVACNGSDAMRNARDIVGNMQPAEAAALALRAGWATLISGHNDMFASNRLPAAEVASQIERVAPRLAHHTLTAGELLIVQR
ncbi:MAG: hypothetical protein RLZZ297_920 [Chloroflexota bacterium]